MKQLNMCFTFACFDQSAFMFTVLCFYMQGFDFETIYAAIICMQSANSVLSKVGCGGISVAHMIFLVWKKVTLLRFEVALTQF